MQMREMCEAGLGATVINELAAEVGSVCSLGGKGVR